MCELSLPACSVTPFLSSLAGRVWLRREWRSMYHLDRLWHILSPMLPGHYLKLYLLTRQPLCTNAVPPLVLPLPITTHPKPSIPSSFWKAERQILWPFGFLFYMTTVHMHKTGIFSLFFSLPAINLSQRLKLIDMQTVERKLISPPYMVDSPSFSWLISH